MKKSGLADSPFFTKPVPPAPVSEPVVLDESQGFPSQDVFKRTDAQTHERTVDRLHKRTNEHLSESTDAQIRSRANAQKQIGAKAIERLVTRESFDIYEDQLETFEQLRLHLKKARGRHIGKGELLRELLDQILLKK
ncbi:MAG: hypothetical protein LCI00_19340 [Chloroflexi bacterium]|nr:hypothetical protein [Chloroflexota bacterium]MCC6891444.1 hypothetical protein [Anaerolineae bacterium]